MIRNGMPRLAVFFAAFALAACSDSTSPGSVSGVWHLRTVDGHPADQPPPGATGVYLRKQETLTLFPGGSYSDHLVVESVDAPSGVLLGSQESEDKGTWTYTAPDLQLNGTLGHGTVMNDTLRIQTGVYTR